MINPATSWFNIHQYGDRQAISVANIAKEEWFSRYPWPTQVTFDGGSEFIGHEFKKTLNDYEAKKKPITTRNPQANAIVKGDH
jgi:transposase InsO family protein